MGSEETSVDIKNCIICNSKFFERKPILGQLYKLKNAFTVFYQSILCNDEETEENTANDQLWQLKEDKSDHELVLLEHPFCDSCYSVLMKVLELQEIIDRSKAEQMQRSVRLKEELCNNENFLDNTSKELNRSEANSLHDSLWIEMKTKLLNIFSHHSEIRNKNESDLQQENDVQFDDDDEPYYHFGNLESPIHMEEERQPFSNNNALKSREMSLDQMKSCFVNLKKLSHSKLTKYGIIAEQPSEGSFRSMPGERSTRRSKRKAYTFLRKCLMEEENDEVEEKSNSNYKRRKIRDAKFKDDSEFEFDQCQFSHSSKTPMSATNYTREKPPTPPENGVDSTRKTQHFKKRLYKIPENLILYGLSMFKMLPTGLICQEENCTETTVGCDYNSWRKMQKHVDNVHSEGFVNCIRKCPLCEMEFRSAAKLRSHLINFHVGTVRRCCELCWKVFSNSYIRHLRRCHKDNIPEDFCKTEEQNLKQSHSEESQNRKEIPIKMETVEYDQCQFSRTSKTPLKTNSTRKKPTTSENYDNSIRKTQPFKKRLYNIPENLILYGLSMFKILPSSFVCQEENCTETVVGRDYHSWKKMQKHLDDIHSAGFVNCLRKCPLCQLDFSSAAKLRYHLINFHIGTVRRCCELCWKVFSNSYIRHLRLCHKDNMPEDFKKGFTLTTGEQNFKNSHSEESLNRRKTQQFTMLYKTPGNLILYRLSMFKKSSTRFICQEENCTETIPGCDYYSWKKMQEHLDDIHSEGFVNCIRNCPICEMDFNSATKLRSHLINFHRGIVKRCCELCWKGFGDSDSYPRHLRRCHKDNIPEDFEKGFTFVTGEQNLKNSHSEESPSQKRTPINLVPVEYDQCQFSQPNKTPQKTNCTREKPPTPPEDGDDSTRKTQQFKKRLYKIPENLILYGLSFFKMLPTSFICQEENCTETVAGSDYRSWKKMQKHLDDIHSGGFVMCRRKCPLCQLDFSSAAKLRSHLIKSHIGTVRRCCELCWKVFSNSYIRHLRLCHKDNMPEDFKKGFTLTTGEQNFKNSHSEKSLNLKKIPISEELKDGSMTSEIEFHQHHSSQSKSLIASTSVATARSKTSTEDNDDNSRPGRIKELFYLLNEDYLMYGYSIFKYSRSEFVCQENGCEYRIKINGYDFFAFEDLKIHVGENHPSLTHNDSDQTKCPICNVFVPGRKLKSHILTHNPPVLCKSCWKPMSTGSIKRHSWSHLNDEEKAKIIQESPDCPLVKKMTTQRGLRERTIQCSQCPKMFSDATLLKHHEVTHLPRHLRKLYHCPDCDLKLLSIQALRSHIERTHRPELAVRKRICPICSQVFHIRDGDRYRAHIRRHKGETPWMCHLCGKGFKSNGDFTVHQQRVHTTNRIYQCEFCTQNYKHPYNLTRHRQKVHQTAVSSDEQKLKFNNCPESRPGFIGPRIAYPCEHCDQIFQLRSRMTKHVKTTHPEKVNESTSESNGNNDFQDQSLPVFDDNSEYILQ